MKTRVFGLCAAALALAACSEGTKTNTMPIVPAPIAGSGSAVPVNPGPIAPGPGVVTAPPGGGAAGSMPTTAAGTSGAVTAGTGGAPAAAGSGGTAATAGSAAMAGSMAMEEPPPAGPLEPIIPEVTGTCPEFASGTKTVGGLSGISFNVGAKKEGTGSLIFYWHGTGSSSFEASNIPAAATKEITDAGGIIVAFGGSTGTGGDCSGTATFGKDDFKIADIITGCAVKNHGIDPRRIYTTGCSAGGLMAGCMGIQRSNYIAATAPNSGGITVGYGMFEDPKRVPAVMTMHGSAADMVIVAFSQTSEAYDNFMLKAGSFVINCNHGGGHCGASSALQSSAWKFMKDHPFGTKPSPYAMGLPTGFDSSCKIFSTMTDVKPLGGP